MSLPLTSWMVVAVALIVAERLVVYLLHRGRTRDLLGVAHVVVASVGAGRGDEVLSAAVGFFCVPPSVGFVVSDLQVVAVAWSRSMCEGRARAVEG
jgi:hypothetical protein